MGSSMNKTLTIAVCLLLLSTVSWAKESKKKEAQPQKKTQQQSASQPPVSSSSPYFTGDGGKGMSIAILAPKTTGVASNQDYLPALVQGEFVSNFSGYSAISVLDRQRLDDQYTELFSGYYDDKAQANQDLGHLTPTTHIMGGNITRTATGYALQIQITKTADKMTAASYSGTCTFAELDNLTGIRRASLELLQKMGVTPTERTKTELSGAAAANQVNAQTALAKGVTAQQRGTEVAALSYYFQAAAFEPTLLEAANRSTVLAANISSGNIGANIRNDIEWRKQWVAKLTETEDFFQKVINDGDPPYTLFYSTGIEQGAINYTTETAALSIRVNMQASGEWFNAAQKAVKAVYDGLNATKRKEAWGLANWPQQGLTRANPFDFKKQYDFAVVFELVNEQNRVIGRQTVKLTPSYAFSRNRDNSVAITYNENNFSTVTFNAVKAADISDNLTIRIATVNNTAPENVRFPIAAIPDQAFQESFFILQIENGVVEGFVKGLAESQKARYRNLELSAVSFEVITSIESGAFSKNQLTGITIPNSVTSIGKSAFSGNQLTNVTIPNSVTSIENSAFADNQLTSVTIGNSVTSIGNWAFSTNKLTSVTIPNSVTTIGEYAFYKNQLTSVIIGNSVTSIGDSAFCKNQLTSITIPNSVISIGKDAFWDNKLTSVTIPNSVTSIGKGAFFNNQLTSVVIGNSVTSIGDGAFQGNQLTSVTIGNSVTSIGENAFMGTRLTSIIIPNSVTSIGKEAFFANPLISITIGSNVRLGKWVFGSDEVFANAYAKNNSRAGTYTKNGDSWSYRP